LQRLAIVWSLASFLISAWTLFAISQTWLTSLMFPKDQRIFGGFAFATLTGITVGVLLANLFTLHACSVWNQPCQRRRNGRSR
jgi:hypothetical protein